MKYVLGVSAFYHDSAAVLIGDGGVICAVEEERFSRKKHDNGFPENAIQFCLDKESIKMSDIDMVSFYEKPLKKFERILDTFVSTYPKSIKPFLDSMPEWLGKKINVDQEFRKLGYEGEIFYVPHHLSHAAATYFGSGLKSASVLTVDGVGENTTTALWGVKDGDFNMLKKIDFPNSLGLLYSTFTAFLGMRVNNDEYKMMGLAAYGTPKYLSKISRIVDVRQDGSFKLNMDYFSYRETYRMYSDKFISLFGEPRKSGGKLTTRHKDMAASIQMFTEEIYLSMVNHLIGETGNKNLCVGGGVGLNSLANGKLQKESRCKYIYIFGPSGDSGAALGAAYAAWNKIYPKKKIKKLNNLYLGSEHVENDIENLFNDSNLKWKKYDSETELIKNTAILLKNRKVVGWFQGKMEFGPRALGSRSILAMPDEKKMNIKVNKIKNREQYRPFAGSILEEDIKDVMEIRGNQSYFPHMNFCFVVRSRWREKIGAVVHKDNTCRVQTVNKDNGLYYRLIKEYKKQTGLPIVMNTSFNLAGEPIVESPAQAIYDFSHSSMDGLVVGNYIVLK